MSALVVIPARWASTRLPGKPLMMIAGRTLLARVIDVARDSIAGEDADLLVATDDARISDHARELGAAAVMTDPAIATGSGRALAAALSRPTPPAFVCCLQGDAPFMPSQAVRLALRRLAQGDCDCVTPIARLDWQAVDALREHKRTSPSSGTTCVCAADGRALWFSKAVLPQMRDEAALRRDSRASPVNQHLGLYAYTLEALRTVEAMSPSHNEMLEGLEQLRILELGLTIQTVEVDSGPLPLSGIDTPADLRRAERLIGGVAEHVRE